MTRQPERKGGNASTQVLRHRAQALARPPLEQEAPADAIDVLEFRLAEERYAFEASAVHDVQPLRELTQLPFTPGFLAGVANIRGRLLAVIDFKRFFDLEQRGITDLHSIILLRGRGAGGTQFEIGFLADTVVGVHGLPRKAIQPSPLVGQGIQAEFLMGVTEDRLAVLDAAAILADPRLVINEDVEL